MTIVKNSQEYIEAPSEGCIQTFELENTPNHFTIDRLTGRIEFQDTANTLVNEQLVVIITTSGGVND